MKSTSKLLTNQKTLTILMIFLTVIESLGRVASSLTLAPLTDQLISKNLHGVVFWLLSTIGIWGVTLTVNYGNSLLKAQIIRKVTNQLRVDIANGLNTVPISEYKKVNHNEYVSWLTNDVNMIDQNGLEAFFSLLSSATTLLFGITSLAFYHYSLALAAIILGLLTMTIPQFFSKVMTHETNRLATANSSFLGKADDIIGGFSVFFSHNLGNTLTNKLATASDHQGKEKLLYTKNVGLVNLLISGVNVGAQMLVMTLTCLLVIGGYFSVGVISASGSLAGTVFNNLAGMIQSIFQMKSVAVLLDKDIQATKIKTVSEDDSFNHALTVDHLSFGYEGKPVIKDISYNFEKGGKYAVVGKSGAGKSTLINLISGRLRDYAGTIQVDGDELKSMPATLLNAKIELVDQKSYIFNESIEENITLGHAKSQALLSNVVSFLGIDKFTNLATKIHEHGSNLSGGQRQKLALARALAFHKPILIVDEVTAGIDSENAQEIEDALLAEKDLTVIMITHNLTEKTRAQLTDTLELA